MTYRTNLVEVTSDRVAAQNVDALTSDFQVRRAGNLVRITIAASAVIVKLVPNTGTGLTLGTGTAFQLATYELALDPGRTWNLQTTSASGITIYHLVVQEIEA